MGYQTLQALSACKTALFPFAVCILNSKFQAHRGNLVWLLAVHPSVSHSHASLLDLILAGSWCRVSKVKNVTRAQKNCQVVNFFFAVNACRSARAQQTYSAVGSWARWGWFEGCWPRWAMINVTETLEFSQHAPVGRHTSRLITLPLC
jgi:hypothetical protein